MSQTVYNYAPDTRIFTGASEADESPLEPGVYLIPAHAVTEAPPEAPAGSIARRRADGGGWEVVPDVRGTWYGADGAAVEISDLDADVSALTRQARPDAMHKLEGGQWVVCAQLTAQAEAAERDALCARIDAAVAAIYAAFTRFEAEYNLREAQARAYQAAGYAGEVPVQVAAFAGPAGKSAQEAAEIIIREADKLHEALSRLGALRMRKYEVKGASGIEAARAAAEEVLTAIAAIGAAL